MVLHDQPERLRYNSDQPTAIADVLINRSGSSSRSGEIPLGSPTCSARTLWVPVIRFMSCDLRILMDQPAESIPSGNPSSRRDDRWFGGPKRWGLPKARCGRWPL